MKIIFMVPAGIIEWPVPDELKPQFNFNAVATTTRLNGFFMAENLYLKHDCLIGMSFAPDDTAITPRRELN
jgi:hypothetical protein